MWCECATSRDKCYILFYAFRVVLPPRAKAICQSPCGKTSTPFINCGFQFEDFHSSGNNTRSTRRTIQFRVLYYNPSQMIRCDLKELRRCEDWQTTNRARLKAINLQTSAVVGARHSPQAACLIGNRAVSSILINDDSCANASPLRSNNPATIDQILTISVTAAKSRSPLPCCIAMRNSSRAAATIGMGTPSSSAARRA